jgi:hypothetical protein
MTQARRITGIRVSLSDILPGPLSVKHWHRGRGPGPGRRLRAGGPGRCGRRPDRRRFRATSRPPAGERPEPESRVGSGCHGHVSTSCGHRDGRPLGIMTVTTVTFGAAGGGIRP